MQTMHTMHMNGDHTEQPQKEPLKVSLIWEDCGVFDFFGILIDLTVD